MFEAYVLYLLRKYLGEYVKGLSTEVLRVSVWNGDVVLKDLHLKAEALNSLNLPVTVDAGFIGAITLKVPWKSLGKEPVIVLIDRVFVLAHPAPDGQTLNEEDREKLFEAKLQQIEELEAATLEAKSNKSKIGNPSGGNSWFSSLVGTIIGNLKITISNVHIRYEDAVSNPGHPFCCGVTLAKLAAVTMDEQGNETFDTSGALDKLRKSLQLQRLALYHDSDCHPWKLDKNWDDLNSDEWVEIFEDGINESATDPGSVSVWAMNRTYLVSPINGVLKYHRLGKQERKDPESPFEQASLVLNDVSLTISEAQYHDGIRLLEIFSRYRTRVDVSHLRPVVPVQKNPHSWWRFAAQAGLQQKNMSHRISWDRIWHLCQLRRRYIQLYAAYLQQLSNVEMSEIRKIEKDLDSKVILLWRLLAHAKVETVKSKEAAQQRNLTRNSWWSFAWRTSSKDLSVVKDSNESQLQEEELTKEEWHAINKILSYQPDEEMTFLSGKEMQIAIQFLVNVSIRQAATTIISIDKTEILCGRFEDLQFCTKIYHKSTHCDISLKFYGLSAPEGSLAESVISEAKANALAANFVHSPAGDDVDWRLSATIAPCHVTVLMESIDRFLEFLKRSNAVSPTVALETATALQIRIEKVTRRAQEHLQMVLEEQSRFALDIDLDAPKLVVPMKGSASSASRSYFLLDFGHFTLTTNERHWDDQRQSLYSRFYISGRDFAAFFMDAGPDSGSNTLLPSIFHGQLTLPSPDCDNFCSLIDRCGMSVIVDQIKVPHPSYPSTRVSIQVPNLSVHFSPERYRRISDLIALFYSTMESADHTVNDNPETVTMSWYPAELSSSARILVWRGIGNSIAEWQPCFLVLSGVYLYVLESETSQSYQRCLSMAGRQVFEVSPTNVGGSLFSVAVCFRGLDIQKALESSNTLIIEFQDDEEKALWFKQLTQATYRASAPASVDILEESSDKVSEQRNSQVNKLGKVDLVISGALIETKLFIYGKAGEKKHVTVRERLILEIIGGGGKINLLYSGIDLAVKMKLHSFKIRDELQGCSSPISQYLARSVLKDDSAFTIDASDKKLSEAFPDEDDTFKDALPDFLAIPDQSFYPQNHEILYNMKSGLFGRADYSCSTDSADVLFHDNKDVLKGKNIGNEVFYEAEDSDSSHFVVVTFLTRNPVSPLYDGIDTQMCIRMSKLEFFCNRPTLVALIEFGMDLSLGTSSLMNSGHTNASTVKSSEDVEKIEDNGPAYVKGLLGYGKGRVIFYLKMDVDSFCIYLNKEDGSQLAMLVQESFLLDLKIHPGSLTIEGKLGNLKLCDMSVGPDHCWGWLCDTRNQGTDSLIKSYSVEDDDYEGHDYSLHGRLSAVRIVFVYRFVQEITAYLMELATPDSEEEIRLVDKVGGFEWLIEKYEIEGASAIKLDLSLESPIIIVPRSSKSKDSMQLDLHQLRIRNSFTWHGDGDDDPSSVHLDVLQAEIHGINMAVGVNGIVGKPMIREGQGLKILVRRSLRDVFRKVPTLSLHVQVGLLHGVMSNKEYDVIINSLYANLSEEPMLPPSFRSNMSALKDSKQMLVDNVNLHSQTVLSRTVRIMSVEISYALLELCNISDEQSPLAHVALEGLWVSYRSTSLCECDLYVTIPKFCIVDIRLDTKPEMRLMLGSSWDVSKQGVYAASGFANSLTTDVGSFTTSKLTASEEDAPNLTMLVMDYRFRPSSQSVVLRIQQPRVLVVPDFLLAVGEFFVPSLGSLTGRAETLDPKNDPIFKNNSIVLSTPLYKQTDAFVHLSPSRQLIVDGFGSDEFTYDGCGGTICLSQDAELKEEGPSEIQPIILIGRGKMLRFKNVKIENGALLRKFTYLSNDSSYSVSKEDGVDISLLDSFAPKISEVSQKPLQDASVSLVSTAFDGNSLNRMQSTTFEAQVVSSEFTFYDSSKLSSDDSLHGEKMLRAKLDLSYMFAAKENDKWLRIVVKDFTIEAGSGIVVLDPVDISGGYTSIIDKTNISVISSDICIHLSLSVISLVLNLQNQAAEALQFGNANVLAACVNFDQVWVSQKGNRSGHNPTFWRPRAPSNYVILGDCITSRPVPPTQTVMAVNNSYSRVRKPLGFHLIGSFSCFNGSEGHEGQNGDSDVCSLWLPVAPQGYITLGCVASVGRKPPPNHVVYCLRSDLASSSGLSDCVITLQPNSRFSHGFSIWRFDNSVGSFYAHDTVESPPKDAAYDLHQILFRNPGMHLSYNDNESSSPTDNDVMSQEESNRSNSSGWDVLRSISRPSSFYVSTPHFERIWWDKGCDLRRPVSIWRPAPRHGFSILGDCIVEGLEPPTLGLVFKCDSSGISSKPVQFTKVANISGKGFDEIFFWYPIAPPGYASLGCIVSRTDEAPSAEFFCCPRMDLVTQANISESAISGSSTSKGSDCWSIWKVENQAGTFLARSDLKKPSNRLAYGIGDYVKPKTRENISAELKLQCISLTILDSFGGMMTPLFDTTITNVNLATHGQFKSMNAVLICSIAASYFNAHLEAWEPVVESFDGIFKFETYDTDINLRPKVGKRVRIAVTNTLNLNISAANLETLAESIISWRRLEELEQKRTKDIGSLYRSKDDVTVSALEDDDFQKVILENKLGCDVFLKKIEQNSEIIELLQNGNSVSVWLPPIRFSERLNIAAKSREPRSYVAVQIYESRGLSILDDGNGHDFFCALRLVIDGQSSDQQKLFPQSARTRCVKPLVSKEDNLDEGIAKWNELFIFEIPQQGHGKLEVEVTNLASKAGKGEVVGAFSIDIGKSFGQLKRVVSSSILRQQNDMKNLSSYPLHKRGLSTVDGTKRSCGCLLVCTSYYEKKNTVNFKREMENSKGTDSDIGFWVALNPEGPWESFRSLLPLLVVPKMLNENFLALEVMMKNGRKYASLRGLAVVVNDADIPLEVSTYPLSMLHNHASPTTETSNLAALTEEIFENQRYQPISGWGNKWPGFRGNDPGRWSTRDFSYSSKDFFEPPLPPGWQWTSPWRVEKSKFVDDDGWAYGTDYQNLKWPPNSPKSRSKSTLDFVRRRRWIRTRKQVPENATVMRNTIAVILPLSSAVLPWRSMAKDSDLCLQVRPFVEYSQVSYTWGCAVSNSNTGDQLPIEQNSFCRQNTMKSGNSSVPNSGLLLNQLEKQDMLVNCNPGSGSKQCVWFSIGVDASVHQMELNTPVYDWKISINSPIKLENRLPCQADYTIWEKAKEGNRTERQHGIITSGSSSFIYSADIRRSVYLTLFLQGGWVLEKDAIPILDLSALDHISSFWMVHQQSHRRLRVSIERDLGGTSAAPKRIRLFVPYWIVNDSPLSLAYRVVEVEPIDSSETDSLLISRAVKSAKLALKDPTNSVGGKNLSSRRNIQILETVEDVTALPVMLSPQDYISRSGLSPFSSQNEAFLSPRLGIAVAICPSEHYSPGISLLELENKERVDVRAFNPNGSYYKLSALLTMTSNRTKVVHFQTQIAFINRIGRSISLQQCGTQSVDWVHPHDPPKPFLWQSISKNELLKLRINGFHWSLPFSVENEGVICVSLKNELENYKLYIKVEIRSGGKSSHYEVVFRLASSSSPFRIENRSVFLPLRFRQAGGSDESWRLLPTNAAASYFWEDFGRQRLLEVLIDGTDSVKSQKYNIEQIDNHEPMLVSGGPVTALCVTILKEGKTQVVKIMDWMPSKETAAVVPRRHPLTPSHLPDNELKQSLSTSDSEFHVIVELAELGVSVIDHTPEEILYLSLQNLLLSYSTGLGSGISRFKLRMHGIQLDNQLPLTPMPVLFRPQRITGHLDYVLKLSMTMQSDGTQDLYVYPYLGFQGPENIAFLVKLHEPIIWRLHEMVQQVSLSRVFGESTTSVALDPIIQIGLLNVSEIRVKVTLAMSPSQRPAGVLGFWLSLMTALGNTENMLVRIHQRFHEDVCMRQSALVSAALANIQKDLLSQPLQLLSGVDILGNASSALGHMSKGVAALSMDKKFIQGRQKQENKGVEDLGDVIREGGGALAKGLFRGVTGILTKPLEGAKSSGVEGFVQGVGKGIIGAAAQPVSGVLDLLSKTTEGANAMRMKITSAITSEEQSLRRRLPRVIGGDNLLRPYDDYKAQGQVILQLAESGAFFGQVDLFKVRGKFALSDAYEDHFLLPKGKIVLVTHRRVILLQQPSNIMAQRKFNPARDPCSVLWDVLWDGLATMELVYGKKDNPRSPPSQLVLYLQTRSMESSKETVRVIKCTRDSQQAAEIYISIEQAMNAFGPKHSKDLKKKVAKPYSPHSMDISSGVAPKQSGIWSTKDTSTEIPCSPSFGTVATQTQFGEGKV